MLKKLCLFQIIILTLRHKNKKLVSIMAKTERQKRIYRKRIPYGMQNFEDVIKEDCYFVDNHVQLRDGAQFCGQLHSQRL